LGASSSSLLLLLLLLLSSLELLFFFSLSLSESESCFCTGDFSFAGFTFFALRGDFPTDFRLLLQTPHMPTSSISSRGMTFVKAQERSHLADLRDLELGILEPFVLESFLDLRHLLRPFSSLSLTPLSSLSSF